ncbi:class II histone deacetylase [Natrarchaeobius halalkaliphilus]|uniref:Class II histone deacetylase n=1 Tax=Natrarchaeobius halalkaliphilus TaxID=1679091 RepID=A0A3N6LP85_9EURY|nr:class II histone deacetylase [Natrarchaeobius halalkaliphilus]RQG88077.1 class II histone deacetylase [Natrarchaeobius halalkaliphilus]
MSSQSTLSVYWDDSFLEHNPPAGEFELASSGRLAVDEPHPDRPERVQNIKHILDHELSEFLEWQSVEPATIEQLSRVHTASHISEFEEFCKNGGGRITAETGANEASYTAARHAAGASIQAATDAMRTDVSERVPYALVRPSGHHAQPDQIDGFCFFNNVAIAAEHLRATDQAERIAIIDWDVHHGNGIQETFYDRDDVLYVSIHNDHWSWDPDAHPQTGNTRENGTGDGVGYNVNIPLPPGAGDKGYEYVFNSLVSPIVESFDPDVLLVSAGQDAGTMDPLGRNVVTKSGFEAMGQRVRKLATECADGHLALIQEGGYHLSHLGYATLGVLEGVLDVRTDVREDPFAWLDEDLDSVVSATHSVGADHAHHWPLSFTPSTERQ